MFGPFEPPRPGVSRISGATDTGPYPVAVRARIVTSPLVGSVKEALASPRTSARELPQP